MSKKICRVIKLTVVKPVFNNFNFFSLEKLHDAFEEMHARDSLLTTHFYDMLERLTGIEGVQVKVSFYVYHHKCLVDSFRQKDFG